MPTSSGAAFDVIDGFGALAGMHAALERAGVGMPCGLAARFPGRSSGELAGALGRAQARFPLLSRRLSWDHDRPVLAPDGGSPCPAPASLGFCTDAAGRWWRAGASTHAGETWLTAVWSHAAADGLSMLRFLHAVEAELAGSAAAPPALDRQLRPATPPPRVTAWTPGFIRDQFRPYLRIESAPRARCGASWIVTSPAARDRVMAQARAACGGVAPWLAAAAAMAVAAHRGERHGEVALNLPIVRDRLQAVGGFGFGVGSLLLPAHLRPGTDMADLAAAIARRARRMAAIGWDGGLRRFLSSDPARHARFAAVRARSRPDPRLTVSWKGVLDPRAGAARDVACFAAAPMLHVSAHADEQGLSISLSAPQPASVREALLRAVTRRLGVEADEVFDLDAVAGGSPRPYAPANAFNLTRSGL